MNTLTIVIAFTAGLVSFLSPCVLPIVPGFLAYLAGGVTAGRRSIMINSLFFVLGFSVVFAALGVLLTTVFSVIAYDVQTWLARLGGVIIIVFGLSLTGLLNIPYLQRDHKIRVTSHAARYSTSFLFGLAFAVGWTPCVGAALGAILALAATQPAAAFSLLFAYALGLGVPFLIAGAFAGQLAGLIGRYGKALEYITIVFGFILIILGVLVFTRSLGLLANFSSVNQLLLQLSS